MTTLSVYCGWTKIKVDDTYERYMGGFRIIYPGKFDKTVSCPNVLFSTGEEATEFARRNVDAYLSLLEVFGVISEEETETVQWEDISPPN